ADRREHVAVRAPGLQFHTDSGQDTTKAGHGHGRGQRTARAARGPGSSAPERASRRGLSVARPAPGAERTVAVLELMAAHPDERCTLSEVARRCGLNRATAHALLSALTARGVLVRHPDEKRYSLGPRLVAIGEAARRGYTAADFV